MFIELTHTNGKKVLVAVEKIACIVPYSDSETHIEFYDNFALPVIETYDKIKEMLDIYVIKEDYI